LKQHRVEALIRELQSTNGSMDASVPFTPVHTSSGKVIRAEPISALYEQSRRHQLAGRDAYSRCKYLIFIGCDGVTSFVQYERHAASNCAR
jgi:phage terminase large subunit-like protein